MENNQKEMSHHESFTLIQAMIDSARGKVAEDGFYLVMWGTLVILSSLANYILVQMGHPGAALTPWLIVPIIGIPAGIYYEKVHKDILAKTHLELHVSYLWWSYGVTILLIIAYSVLVGVSAVPFILLISGLVTFATGLMLKFRPMTAGGLAFWILGAACFWVGPLEHLLVTALAMLLGFVIPGLLLRRLAKKTPLA